MFGCNRILQCPQSYTSQQTLSKPHTQQAWFAASVCCGPIKLKLAASLRRATKRKYRAWYWVQRE